MRKHENINESNILKKNTYYTIVYKDSNEKIDDRTYYTNKSALISVTMQVSNVCPWNPWTSLWYVCSIQDAYTIHTYNYVYI